MSDSGEIQDLKDCQLVEQEEKHEMKNVIPGFHYNKKWNGRRFWEPLSQNRSSMDKITAVVRTAVLNPC